jgi:uncharacterized protein YndB with AHSA1/START domain
MAAQANRISETEESVVELSRTLDAPRDVVWRAWTEPQRLAQWWGPKGYKMLASSMDLRPGGIYRYGMRAPAGQEMWGRFVYREIVPPERLEFIVSFTDADGNVMRHPMSETWPLEVLNTMTFEEHDGKTTITLRGGPINASEVERATFAGAHKSMQQGFAGTFDQLAEYLAKS